MVVIVIVGILSAVALPNFLSQSVKAKGAECTTLGSSILAQVSAEAQISKADANDLGSSLATSETAKSDNCTFTYTNIPADSNTATLDVTGKGEIVDLYDANGCTDYALATRDFTVSTKLDGDGVLVPAATAVCTVS